MSAAVLDRPMISIAPAQRQPQQHFAHSVVPTPIPYEPNPEARPATELDLADHETLCDAHTRLTLGDRTLIALQHMQDQARNATKNHGHRTATIRHRGNQGKKLSMLAKHKLNRDMLRAGVNKDDIEPAPRARRKAAPSNTDDTLSMVSVYMNGRYFDHKGREITNIVKGEDNVPVVSLMDGTCVLDSAEAATHGIHVLTVA